jgi:hypothetical protein
MSELTPESVAKVFAMAKNESGPGGATNAIPTLTDNADARRSAHG